MNEQQIFEALQRGGFENARGEARMLCEAFATPEERKAALGERLSHRPLQYILGEWGFYREVYEVSEACLVPRSDTELLVEKAISLLPPDAKFIDLCTGSGCVAISTLASRPDTLAIGIDLFDNTLALASRNAMKNGVEKRISFQRLDVLTPASVAQFVAENAHGMALANVDAILSNPPYIPNAVVPTLQREVQQEPLAALMGGEDGLDFYRAILSHWSPLLKKDGFMLLEIGYDQGDTIRALAAAHGFSATVWRDFGGCDRVAHLLKNA